MMRLIVFLLIPNFLLADYDLKCKFNSSGEVLAIFSISVDDSFETFFCNKIDYKYVEGEEFKLDIACNPSEILVTIFLADDDWPGLERRINLSNTGIMFSNDKSEAIKLTCHPK